MTHSPASIPTSAPPYAIALASRAVSAGNLVIYAGAGISMSPPTGLPSGAGLAAAVHMQLKDAFPVLNTVATWDLLAIADAVASLDKGEDALRQTSARSANFKTAKPGYAHRVLAHLMLEGVIDIVTTNWDNCIERGAGEEHLPTVTNDHELADVTPPWVLKVHGCASRPSSLLVTNDHLANPPQWVQEQTHARLGSAVVVFIGIGDVAPYVKQRIKEAIDEVGSVENIRVVAPDIETNWDKSQWKTVAPNLDDEDKIALTADQFLEELGAAYVLARLGEHSISLASDSALTARFEIARAGLLMSDSLGVLQWSRTVDINPRVGESVLRSPELGKALVALGYFADTPARLNRFRTFETSKGNVELLITTQTVSSRRLIEAAEHRVQEYANNGEPPPTFIVAGGVGPIPRPESLPASILDEVDETNILDGPLALTPDLRHADELIAS